MHFRSFQSRLLFFFLGLFVLVLVAAFLLVNAAHTRNARDQIDDALEVGAGVFHRLIDDRASRLVEAARLLSGDFAFKTAYATSDRETVLSALENHQARIGSDVMILADMDYEIIADTLRESTFGSTLGFSDVIDKVLDAGEIEFSTIVSLDGNPYQIVVVPLLTPMPDAWICVGFRIDDEFAAEFRRLTLSHVSLLTDGPGGWIPFASTLPEAARRDLAGALEATGWEIDRSVQMELAAEQMVSLVTPLYADDTAVVAVLQRSLEEALRPYLRVRAVLMTLFLAGLAICMALGTVIARSVSRPVLRIAEGARRVEEGDYTQTLELRQQDEIGELARSFNHMVRGLQERDRVRNLLGKVVSPAIAHELMSKEIVLGGEERVVTMLFSDVRGFTSLCEGIPPERILSRLNAYLTRMTAVVEEFGGVVDKYIGDAIMALFGAPLSHRDDASRAVSTALEMGRALQSLNREIGGDDGPGFDMGIGLNTAKVVAGNMGSQTRLNYTVIGDGVNLAARLEGLTKHYGVHAIVSDATRNASEGFLFRELDRVRVKGRSEPVTIHEPLGRQEDVDPATLSDAHEFEAALALYRRRDWTGARSKLARLRKRSSARLYRVYLTRVEEFAERPPGQDWDGTFSFLEK